MKISESVVNILAPAKKVWLALTVPDPTPDVPEFYSWGQATAVVIEEAFALFPGAVLPRDRDERIGALNALTANAGEDVFQRLDEAFYAIPEDVDALLAAYVQAHNDEIAAEPG